MSLNGIYLRQPYLKTTGETMPGLFIRGDAIDGCWTEEEMRSHHQQTQRWCGGFFTFVVPIGVVGIVIPSP